MYYIIRAITLESFHIVTHSQESSLPLETRFYETNDINCFWK